MIWHNHAEMKYNRLNYTAAGAILRRVKGSDKKGSVYRAFNIPSPKRRLARLDNELDCGPNFSVDLNIDKFGHKDDIVTVFFEIAFRERQSLHGLVDCDGADSLDFGMFVLAKNSGDGARHGGGAGSSRDFDDIHRWCLPGEGVASICANAGAFDKDTKLILQDIWWGSKHDLNIYWKCPAGFFPLAPQGGLWQNKKLWVDG